MRIILTEDYRHNPSFGSIILEDLYTSSGRIIILPIGRYLHVLTFLSGGLMEVWAYLWESWYKSWDLWARSSSQLHLSCICTTMISENHWKCIKHSYLHLKTQSPLDQSVYIISYKVINAYTHTAATHSPPGRKVSSQIGLLFKRSHAATRTTTLTC